MSTTIRTDSKKEINKIKNYHNSKRVFYISSLTDYSLTIFNLTSDQTTSLINKMIKELHLSPKQQESKALAA